MTTTEQRRGRKPGQGSKWIRPDKRLGIYLRDGLCCVYCGTTVEDLDSPLTLDHVTPCELGGGNDESNLVTCCLSCNSSKQDLTIRSWFRVLRDRGIDTTTVGPRIRRLTNKDLTSYRKQAKQIIRERER